LSGRYIERKQVIATMTQIKIDSAIGYGPLTPIDSYDPESAFILIIAIATIAGITAIQSATIKYLFCFLESIA
jgi:hypothetical protein